MLSPEEFQLLKIALMDMTGLAKDALHVHIGLGIFVAVRLLWRRRYGWLLAWVAALAAALGGEWFDLRSQYGNGPFTPDTAHWHDVWNTMLWPTLLAIVGRWLQPREPQIGERADEIGSGDETSGDQP
ncbi:MAG: hypothetical protein MUF41_02390 [Sphingopyxis sp.]|nr:hypothetical protein [Sphingopyxis sp.]